MFRLKAGGKDITNFVTRITWSGSSDEVARKIEFELVYNTPTKDAAFTNVEALELGTKVELITDDNKPIFTGKIFVRRRNTDSFVMSYVAYDVLLYLAKSKVHMVFNETSVSDGITKVCTDLGLNTKDIPTLDTKVSFIADDKSGSEVVEMLLEKATVDKGKHYILKAEGDKVSLVEEGLVVEDYIAKTKYNVIHSSHSESVEDVVNKVVSVDEVGKVVTTYEDKDLIQKIGILQDVYKIQPAKPNESVDNVAMAKAKLKKIKMESSISVLGDIRVQTGVAIIIQEEQLKGEFLVISDTHTFEKNYHTMELGLQFVKEASDEGR